MHHGARLLGVGQVRDCCEVGEQQALLGVLKSGRVSTVGSYQWAAVRLPSKHQPVQFPCSVIQAPSAQGAGAAGQACLINCGPTLP